MQNSTEHKLLAIKSFKLSINKFVHIVQMTTNNFFKTNNQNQITFIIYFLFKI